MYPSLIEIGSKTAEKNCTNKQTDRHYENMVNWPWTNYVPWNVVSVPQPSPLWPTVSFFNVHVWKCLMSTSDLKSNGRNGQDGQPASPCQTLRRSVKPLRRYGDFSKMAEADILNFFLSLKFLTVGRVRRVELRHDAKFRGDRSNCRWDMAIFQYGGCPSSWICDAHI